MLVAQNGSTRLDTEVGLGASKAAVGAWVTVALMVVVMHEVKISGDSRNFQLKVVEERRC